MGSGVTGNYNGTIEKSQAYFNDYSVVDDMLEIDKKDSDIYDPNTGYFVNPTATNLNESISGNSIIINGKKAHGSMTYVLDENGNIIPTEIANILKEHFEEVAIDEYQDSNLIQEYILNSVSNSKNMFKTAHFAFP